MKPREAGKLNERNIVDIVQHLISAGRLQLIHSQDGKEYFTPERLTGEIIEVVDKNMGRMSLMDLSSYIGVGIEVIEPTVMDLCAHGRGKLVNGTYITNVFLELFLECKVGIYKFHSLSIRFDD